MKKPVLFIIIAAFCAALLPGCTQEMLQPDDKNVISVSLPALETRTAIDGVKVSWTAGDAIAVNGVTSSPLTEDSAVGRFSFGQVVSTPYEGVYPASIYKDAQTLTLPSERNADSQTVILGGRSETAGQLQFSSLTAMLKVTVVGTSETVVKKVVVAGLGGEQIAGDFTIDYSTLKLTGISSADADKALTVNCDVSLAEPLVLYLPVPAGEYPSGFKVTVTDQNGDIMTRNTSARTLEAGQLRGMPAVTWKVNGIADAADFAAFAAAVNSGAPTLQWENEQGWVNLLADIDFADVTSWTPVGFAVASWGSGYNPEVTEGFAFTGKFDGNAHHIKNFHLVCDETVSGRHWGLFGCLGEGAIVQNFVIEDNCSLTVNTSASVSAGLVAGVLYDADVRDVTSYAPMTYAGSATGLVHMALVGGMYSKNRGCTVDSVHNYGAMTATNTENLNAGATGIHMAGIVGFTNAPSGSTFRNTISSCNNYGDMTSQAGRTAGIIAAANCSTDIIGCENRGNQLNTMPKPDGSRLGNIVCYIANNSTMSSCKNYGNLVSTTSGRCGGLLSLPSNAGPFTDCENYGEIITDSQYRGVFFGYINSVTTWEGGVAGGKVGTYNNGSYEYDLYPESGKVAYLGKTNSTGAGGHFNNITYLIQTGAEQPDPDLEAAADFRIFFIGNSFTKDAVEHLPGILNAAGLNNIQLVHMYYGGRTIPEYNSGWSSSADYHCYLCNPGQTSWTDITGKSLAQVAISAKFDIVTIQEHTGRQLAWGWTTDEKAAVSGLVQKVKEAQSSIGASPKLYYILSQAYHDLSKAQNVTKPFSTTNEMWTCIASQGQAVMNECSFDGIISTGAMLQNLRTSGLNNDMGLTRDGYHMDYGLARYGASCTVFETIIGPFNGNVTMDANSFRYSSTAAGTTAVTDASAPIALKAARYAIANPYDVTDMQGEGGSGGQQEEQENISIGTAAEFAAFAARVNGGDEAAAKANVTLTDDIDFSGLDTWTPIGDATSSGNGNNASAAQGPVFSGVFDGAGHTLRSFKYTVDVSDGRTWGLFGYVYKATLKNFTVEADMTFSASGTADAAIVAGTANSSTIENVQVTGKVTSSGASVTGKRFAIGGIAGFAFSTVSGTEGILDCDIKDCTVSLTVNADGGSNLANGAAGAMYGGIAGFCTNAKNDSRVRITDCVNNGAITAKLGRCSGITATANYGTIIKGCTNNASQYNTVENGRIGQIVCNLSAQSGVIDCQNNGDLTTTDAKTTTGGLIALMGDDTCYLEGGDRVANTATIISGFDPNTDSSKRRFSGLIGGYINKFNHVSDVKVGGRLGVYKSGGTPEMYEINSENFMTYIGCVNSNYTSKVTGLSYVE
jgi:hypothetical protein